MHVNWVDIAKCMCLFVFDSMLYVCLKAGIVVGVIVVDCVYF